MEVVPPVDNHRNFEFPYDRQKLLDKVRENKDKHVKAYEEAWQGYLIELQEQLDEIVKDARASAKKMKDWKGDIGEHPKDIEFHFSTSAHPPQSHADEYDRVIDMLAFTDIEQVTLNQQEFNQYVRDEWQWSRMFNETAGAYSAKFRAQNA